MSASSKNSKKQIEIAVDTKGTCGFVANRDAKTEKVLYQKMGDKWFSFCVVNDEVFMAAVPEEIALAKKNNRMA